jgi:hypothetical protein
MGGIVSHKAMLCPALYTFVFFLVPGKPPAKGQLKLSAIF